MKIRLLIQSAVLLCLIASCTENRFPLNAANIPPDCYGFSKDQDESWLFGGTFNYAQYIRDEKWEMLEGMWESEDDCAESHYSLLAIAGSEKSDDRSVII